MRRDGIRKKKRRLVTAAALRFAAAALLAAVYFLWEEPPVQAARPAPEATPGPTPTPAPAPTLSPEELERLEDDGIAGEAFQAGSAGIGTRKDGVYTILLAGIDDASFLTDTIVVGYLDTVKHEMNFVNIPRDTVITSGGKINSVYYGANRDAGSDAPGAEALKGCVSDIMGYSVDCYAFIDIKTFIKAIDAMGGVWFDVPVPVEFEDQANGYSVYQAPGYYHLDGETAMGVVRYRAAYPTGDLGRIETQHAFLKAVAEQCLSLGRIPHMKKVLDIITDGVQTDLSPANIAWFMRQALKCGSGSITFMTVPAHNVFWNDFSYAAIEPWQWCEMLNGFFNIYEDVTYYPQSLNVIYEDYGQLRLSSYPLVSLGPCSH